MESPINVVKSNVTVSKILGFIIVAFVAFAIFDAIGLTPWILTPVTQAKRKWTPAAP